MYKQREKHSFKVFSEDIRLDKIENIILMFGVEQYLVKWAIDSIVNKYVNKSTMEMDYISFDGIENPPANSIISACETFSMFSEKRVIVVRDFPLLLKDTAKGYTTRDIELFKEYVKNFNEKSILIFASQELGDKSTLSKFLKKEIKCYDFCQIENSDLMSFARKNFRTEGIDISPSVLKTLIDATGYTKKDSDYRLFNLQNDIKKVIALSKGGVITEEDISRAISGDLDTYIFDMLDSISNNQKDKGFSILHNMLNTGSDAMPIIGAIVSQFELILEINQFRKDGMGLSEIHKKLGGSEWRIKKLMPISNKYSEEKLKQILSDIYQVEREIKTGMLDSQMSLEMFIAKI